MRQKLSKEKIVERFRKQNLELLSEYTTANTKVLVKCLKCGYEWKVYPKHVFSGHSCPKCAGNKLSKNDILKRIEKKNLTLLSEIDKIKNRNSIIKVKCKKCGYIYETKLGNIYRGQGGCRKCAKNLKLTQKEAIEKFNELGFELLSEYTNMQTKVKVKCKQCEAIYETTPSNILVKKRGCKECNKILKRKKQYLTQDDITERLNIKGLLPITEYKGVKERIKVKCLKCGYIYETTPDSIFHSHVGCRKCALQTPKWEDEIYNTLTNTYKINVITNYRLSNGKEIDIYLPEYKIGIELNGLYWHSFGYKIKNSFNDNENKAKWHIYNKKMDGLKEGIDILFIYEHEYYNKIMFKKILSFILSKVGINLTKIFARKCKFQKIDHKVASEFYNNNHVIGKPAPCKHFGLIYDDNLVSLMSFKKYNNHDWLITRYCTKIGYSVIGGFNKLLSNSCKELNIKNCNIMTFIDLRFVHPINNVFVRNGFEFVNLIEPRYFYWKGNPQNPNKFELLDRIHAQKKNLQKILPEFDPKLTENENVFKYYLGKCYDAGKYKLMLHVKSKQ